MSKLVTVKKEVEKLKQKLAPKHQHPLWVIFAFGPDDRPHGKYRFRKINVYTGQTVAVSEEDEIKMLHEHYEKIPLKVRRHNPKWLTFEDYLEYHRCKCGKHE